MRVGRHKHHHPSILPCCLGVMFLDGGGGGVEGWGEEAQKNATPSKKEGKEEASRRHA
jgi:hypothetical protein